MLNNPAKRRGNKLVTVNNTNSVDAITTLILSVNHQTKYIFSFDNIKLNFCNKGITINSLLGLNKILKCTVNPHPAWEINSFKVVHSENRHCMNLILYGIDGNMGTQP
jgi:hypothetical protein